MAVKKDETIEEQYQMFLKMLEKDKEKVPALIKFLGRVTYDTMELGEQGFQPILAISMFVRQGPGDKVHIIIRPIRTSDQKTYEAFNFQRMQELINEAFKQYGIEVWGMSPIDEKEESRIVKTEAEGWLH